MDNRCQPFLQEELKQRIASGKRGELLPTAAELAAEFGVNIKTVNKVLNQLAAAGLVERKRRTGTIISATSAVPGRKIIEVIFSGFTDPFLHPYWSELLKGIYETLAREQYRVILNHITSNPGTHLFDTGRIELSEADGRITVGPCEKRLLDWIAAAKRPMISTGDELADSGIPSVYFDFNKGIADAVKFLCRRKGCRKVGFIGHVQNLVNPGAQQKLHAYLLAYQQYEQLDMNLIEDCWPTPGEGRKALGKILARETPDALITGSDVLVPEINALLLQRNIHIPIVGCDGVTLENPPADYSVVRAPRRECGNLAAELLLKSISDGSKPGRRSLPAVFVPGS